MSSMKRRFGRFNPSRGGHAPGDLRNAFVEWVEDDGQQTKTIQVGEEEQPVEWLFGMLWNCSDIMPSSVCVELDLPPGSTYARAVRQLKSA